MLGKQIVTMLVKGGRCYPVIWGINRNLGHREDTDTRRNLYFHILVNIVAQYLRFV